MDRPPCSLSPRLAGRWWLLLALIAAGGGCQAIDRLRPALGSAGEAAIAERYLDGGDPAGGIAVFKQRAARRPQDPEALYWLGRLYLAGGQAAAALPCLEGAVRLQPDAERHFWLGMAQGAAGMPQAERRSYLEALRGDRGHDRAWTNLGHNYFEGGELAAAMTCYDQALQISPHNPQALFNRGAILERRREPEKARAVWRDYLGRFPDGALAIEAVKRLNASGDFSYRNHPIGRRLLPLAQPRFSGGTAALDDDSCRALQPLKSALGKLDGTRLNVVVHLRGDGHLAALRAQALKRCLSQGEAALDPQRVLLSWFDSPETVPGEGKARTLDFSVRLFLAPGRG
jgi:tetratricopeptide (TPR) repeat protein